MDEAILTTHIVKIIAKARPQTLPIEKSKMRKKKYFEFDVLTHMSFAIRKQLIDIKNFKKIFGIVI